MKILVTGGAGYIGSVVVEQLLAEGEAVVVFDDLSQGHREAVAPAATFVEGTLADRAAIDRVMAEHRPEAVMHFASRTLVGESMQRPFLYLGSNVVNGLNLLQSMVEHQVGRFILSSTANLFDDPEHMPITEAERIVPGSPYGESKYILERMLHWLGRIHGLRYAALRYFNAAGASPEHGEDHDPELHLIPIVLDVALGRRKEITIFGDDYPTPDGTCVRDYIHVLDLAQAHILALRALDGRGLRLEARGVRHNSEAIPPPSAAQAPSPSTGEGRGEGEESPSGLPPASPSPPTPLPPGARGANSPSPSTGEGRGEGEESPSGLPSSSSSLKPQVSGLTYNLGNGQGFSVREVIETARRITGHADSGPRRPASRGRPGDSGGRQREDPPRAGLVAALSGAVGDHRNRLALAPGAFRQSAAHAVSVKSRARSRARVKSRARSKRLGGPRQRNVLCKWGDRLRLLRARLFRLLRERAVWLRDANSGRKQVKLEINPGRRRRFRLSSGIVNDHAPTADCRRRGRQFDARFHSMKNALRAVGGKIKSGNLFAGYCMRNFVALL